MKWLSLYTVFATICLSSQVSRAQHLALEAQFRGEPHAIQFREIPIEANEVFVTGSFSPNNDPYVIVSGEFPDGCHRWARAEVNHREEHMHEIMLFGTVSNSKCLAFETPFIKEIRLGRLSPGQHTLRFFNLDGTYFERQLIVE